MTAIIFFIAFVTVTQALGRDREIMELRRIRCKLPPFLDKLPQDVQSNIETVWSRYIAGDDCTAQRYATNQILKKMPDDVQQRLFNSKNNHKELCTIPPFFDKLPLFAQQKLTDVWSDYVAGEDCNQQLQGTRTVLVSLSNELWKDLRPKVGRPDTIV